MQWLQLLGLSCQLRAQRIVHAYRKPRNNADGAIAPKPGRDLFRGSLAGGEPVDTAKKKRLDEEALEDGPSSE